MNKVVCQLKDDILKTLYAYGFSDPDNSIYIRGHADYEKFLEVIQSKGYQSHETELSIDELEKDGLVLRGMDKRHTRRKIILLCAKGEEFFSNDSFLSRFEKWEKEERDEKRR